MNSKNKKETSKYLILERWQVEKNNLLDDEKDNHSDDLEAIIAVAKEHSEEDGRNQYIAEIKKVVRPIRNPYEVTVEDYGI